MQRGHDAGAGHAERVAERDRAAVDVELLARDAEVLGRRDHLRGERLVDLDEVDVVDRSASRASSAWRHASIGPRPMISGLSARHAARDDARERL